VRFEYATLSGAGQINERVIQSANEKETVILTGASCPECGRLILTIQTRGTEHVPAEEHVLWPLQSTRPPVPKEVPQHIATDYEEAALLLNLSPKASAALSRRCLQTVLREAGNADQYNLSKQIEAVIPTLPTYVAENIDAIRNIGNFAAHPIKDEHTEVIIEVEPGEAEWNLDVLDQLFDFYYVQPALAQKKRDDLNAKLEAAGKPPMK